MRRRKVLLIFSLFLALFISGEAVLAQGEGKPKKAIALIEFENLTDYKEGDIGGRIVSLLETELVKLKRFNVIERQQLDAILREQGLTLSGFLSGVGGAKAGEVKGLDAIITGKVTEYHTVPEESYSSYTDKKGKFYQTYSLELKTRVEVGIKMIDVTSGEILLAESKDGFERKYFSSSTGYPSGETVRTETDALTSKATSECIEKIVQSIEGVYPLEGTILSVEGKEVYIDIGSAHGLSPKQKLRVERVAKVLKHPVTGKVIGVVRDEIGEIEIKETYDTYSKAQIKKTEKGKEIKVGDLCISK